jgi:hypothetical protein
MIGVSAVRLPVHGTDCRGPVQRIGMLFVVVRLFSGRPGALLELIWLLRIRNGGWR